MRTGRLHVRAAVLAMLVLVAPGSAAFGDQDPEDNGEDETVADRGLFSGLVLELEADLEFTRESQGGEATTEVTFDEVGFLLAGRAWLVEGGIKYQSESSLGVRMENLFIQVGGSEGTPWMTILGRAVLPFGVYDSYFVDDPLTTDSGETDGYTVLGGYVAEGFEATAGVFRESITGDDGLSVTAAFGLSPDQRTSIGISWTSDIGKSVGLLEIRDEYVEAGADSPGDAPGVDGGGLFAGMERDPWLAMIEGIASLAAFPAGYLAPDPRRPVAWSLELARRIHPRWIAAARIEGTSELPGTPEGQAGASLTYRWSRHVEVTANYIHGWHHDGDPDLDILSAMFTFTF